MPVRLVDERMGTATAHQALHASGRAGRNHRSAIDRVAAVIILQSALDQERSSGSGPGEVPDPRPDRAPTLTSSKATRRTRRDGPLRQANPA